jgi:hypothetical protein
MRKQLGDFQTILERDLLKMNPDIAQEMKDKFSDKVSMCIKKMPLTVRKHKNAVRSVSDLLYLSHLQHLFSELIREGQS